MSHANAPLTPVGRLLMVRRVEAGMPQAHAARGSMTAESAETSRDILSEPSSTLNTATLVPRCYHAPQRAPTPALVGLAHYCITAGQQGALKGLERSKPESGTVCRLNPEGHHFAGRPLRGHSAGVKSERSASPKQHRPDWRSNW